MKTDLLASTLRLSVQCMTLTAATGLAATLFAVAAEPPTPKPPVAAEAGKPILGATLDEVDGKLQVTRVETGGPADRAGLRRGDTLLSLGRDQVNALDDIVQALSHHRPQDKIAIVVERDGATRTLQAVLGDSRVAAAPSKRRSATTPAAKSPQAENSLPTEDVAQPQSPVTIDGQNLGKTAQGFAQMLRDMTGGLRRGDAATAPTNRPRRPLVDRLSGADQAAAPASAEPGDVQIDLGQQSGGSSTSDLAGHAGTAEPQPRESAGAEAAAPRRGLGARPRPRLERLRDRLGKALDGADAPAFKGSLLQPSDTPGQPPAPRVAARPAPAAAEPLPEASQNRRASNQTPLAGDEVRTSNELKPALGVTLKLRESGVVVSAVVPGGAADRAGLKVGDVLKQFDERPLESVAAATDYIAAQRVGDQIDMRIVRGGQTQTITATLAARSQPR